MADKNKPQVGSIGWVDLTVPDAEGVRDFYKSVVGLGSSGHEMGGYEDFVMLEAGTEKPVAGICHAKGANSEVPPVWLVYFTVASIEESIARVADGGGRVISGPRSAGGYGTFAIIEDPAGVVCALFESA